MDRRDFLQRMFIAGVAVSVPYSVLSLGTGGVIIEKHKTKKLDFGKYQAFLVYNEHIVAYSKIAVLQINTPLIDVTSQDHTEKEFIPGAKEVSIKMIDAISKDHYFVYRECFQSAKKLQFMAKDDMGWKYSGDVYISGIVQSNSIDKPLKYDLDLYGSGPLTLEVPRG